MPKGHISASNYFVILTQDSNSKVYVQNQSGPSNGILHCFCLTGGSTLTSQDHNPSSVVYVSKPTRAIWRYLLVSEFCALLCCSLSQFDRTWLRFFSYSIVYREKKSSSRRASRFVFIKVSNDFGTKWIFWHLYGPFAQLANACYLETLSIIVCDIYFFAYSFFIW